MDGEYTSHCLNCTIVFCIKTNANITLAKHIHIIKLYRHTQTYGSR